MNSQTEREKLLIENAYMSSLHNKLWLTEWNAKNHINLSMTEVSVLEILKEEGPKLAKELAQPLQITSGGITGVCNRLISKGYMIRKRDAELDRRAVIHEITEEGREIVKEAFKLRLEVISYYFDCLTDEEIQNWNVMYKKMLRHQLDYVKDQD